MDRYRSPKDRLDAARSPDTSGDELDRLASSDYDFVRLAVAKNPNTRSDTLERLRPGPLSSWNDQDIAKAITTHSNAGPELLTLIASDLVPLLDNGRAHRMAFDAGLLLCSRPSVPFEAILQLLSAEAVSVQFRKVVARESSRLDVVDNLVNDRSETVRARATERQAALASQRPP